MNSLWSMILPSAINTYNLIILRNFFMDLPLELEEAALLDGLHGGGSTVPDYASHLKTRTDDRYTFLRSRSLE